MNIIGIINRKSKSKKGYDIMYSYTEISKKIIKAKAYPIQINLLKENFNDTINFIKNINGIILPGGDDYTEEELELIKILHQNNIPTLGICLGMQAMAISQNGSIEKTKKHNKGFHNVKINKNSKIHQIINKTNIMVNSRHNYKVTTTDLNKVGITNDNVIEIIEDPNKTFFIGLQWHPESMNDENTNKIFEYFIKKAGETNAYTK